MIYAACAILAGATIAIQASMNARLGVLLNSSLVATGIVFFLSCLSVSMAYMVLPEKPVRPINFGAVPWYLWSGGVLSACGVGMYFFLIPKMGIGSMMSYALSGQILFALISSHYGLFDLPARHISPLKIAGLFLLIAGIALINRNPS